MRARVGFNPNTPEADAGIRIEPPPSLACASGRMRAATAAAAPPEEPPEEYARFQGLRVGPNRRGSVVGIRPNSGVELFPKMVTHMIAVGESTGALDAMLGKIADFYEDEVDQAVASLTALLEPMMMVFLGVVIGFIVIAMYLPIFKMASAIG